MKQENLTNPPSVCVFCSSSNSVPSEYVDAATEMGRLLGEAGLHVIYGGTRIGLMGAMARAARSAGSGITGIVPEHIRARVSDCEDAEALIVTPDLRQRKALMESHADAFLALPGGFGTLEEVLEILTLKQLGLHGKPVVFLDINDFYRPLRHLFAQLYEQRFARREYEGLYKFVDSPEAALKAIQAGWRDGPAIAATKWNETP